MRISSPHQMIFSVMIVIPITMFLCRILVLIQTWPSSVLPQLAMVPLPIMVMEPLPTLLTAIFLASTVLVIPSMLAMPVLIPGMSLLPSILSMMLPFGASIVGSASMKGPKSRLRNCNCKAAMSKKVPLICSLLWILFLLKVI